MRILVVSNLYPPDLLGGYEMGCRQAVDALRGRGHQVRVLTSAPRSAIPLEARDVRRRLGVAEIWSPYLNSNRSIAEYRVTQSQSQWINPANTHALLEELDAFQPDVVYAWMVTGLGGLGLMSCLQFLGVPWTWHLMDNVPAALCDIAGEPAPGLVQGFNHFLSGQFIACSQQLVDEIQRAGFKLNGTLDIVPNWVTGHLGPPRSRYLVDGVLRIATSSATVSASQDKGTDLVVEAAARLKGSGVTRFQVDIFGAVTDQSIPDLIRRHELDDLVHLKGACEQRELQEQLASYDVFAFPTRPREPFGFAPLEAAGRGCVAILPEQCGISEWLVRDVHVLKCERTADALARILRNIQRGHVDLDAIGRRAAAVVARDFHLNRVVLTIERILERCARQALEPGGTAQDAYRMTLLADRLARLFIQPGAA